MAVVCCDGVSSTMSLMGSMSSVKRLSVDVYKALSTSCTVPG